MDKIKSDNTLFQYFEPVIIIVFWLVLFASPVILSDSDYGLAWNQVFRVWISYTPYLLLFLVNHFVLLPYLFFQNRRLLFVGSAVFLILCMAFGESFLRRKMFLPPSQFDSIEQMPPPAYDHGDPPSNWDQVPPPTTQGPPPQYFPPKGPPREKPIYLGFFVISILIIGFDTGLRLSVKWVRAEQIRTFVEKENMQTQLAFLRNQVSPHFFMNTLNNIHALIDIDTDEAKESIIRLSKLMRHLLYDSEAEQISIRKEINFIKNYVDLMRLRYSDKIEIQLRIPPQLPDKLIPPLLFTSFVENAFKHGISYQKSMFIHISFQYSDDGLHFHVRNSHTGAKSEAGHAGIGIVNSKKRLDLLYGDEYTLDIEDKEDEFIVNLTIPV